MDDLVLKHGPNLSSMVIMGISHCDNIENTCTRTIYLGHTCRCKICISDTSQLLLTDTFCHSCYRKCVFFLMFLVFSFAIFLLFSWFSLAMHASFHSYFSNLTTSLSQPRHKASFCNPLKPSSFCFLLMTLVCIHYDLHIGTRDTILQMTSSHFKIIAKCNSNINWL